MRYHVAAGTFAAMAFFILLAAIASVARAAPLQQPSAWCVTYPYLCRTGTMSLLMAKGTSDNNLYIIEVDPTTGAIPVTGSFTASNAANGTTGAAVPATATFVGGTDGTNLRGVKTNTSGELQVGVTASVLPTGASTSAAQTTAQTTLSAIDTKLGGTLTVGLPTGAATAAAQTTGNTSLASIDTKLGGTVAVSLASQPLPTGASTEATLSTLNGKVANDFGATTGAVRTAAVIGNASGAADFGSGPAGSATVRAVLATRHESSATPISVRISDGSTFVTPSTKGRTYADSVRNAYGSTSVTTGAWVQLIASTAANINAVQVFDSCGQTLELGTGAAASETRVMIIPPGGLDGQTALYIPAGTRVSVRAISATCSTGELDITGFN